MEAKAEKSWGNGMPVGLSGYCLMMMLLGLIDLGYLAPENMLFLSFAGIAIFLALFTGGMLTLRNGNTLDGALLTTFSLMFVLGPTAQIGLSSIGLTELPNYLLGYWNLLLAAFIVVWSIPLLKAPFFAWVLTPLMFIPLVSEAIGIFTGVQLFISLAGFFWLVPALLWGLYAMLLQLSTEVGMELPVGQPLIRS